MQEYQTPFSPGDAEKIILPQYELQKSPNLSTDQIHISVPCRLHHSVRALGGMFYQKPGGGAIALGSDVQSTSLHLVVTDSGTIQSEDPVATHIGLILKKIMGFTEGIRIDAQRMGKGHSGYASNHGIMTGAAVAINEMYGRPLSNSDLRMIMAYNYVERNGDKVVLGLETGAAPVVGMYGGFVLINQKLDIEGLWTVPASFSVASYIPNKDRITRPHGFGHVDEDELTRSGLAADARIVGVKEKIIKDRLLPAILAGDFRKIRLASNEIGKLFYSTLMPQIYGERVLQDFLDLIERGVICGISSTGPAFFLLGQDEDIQELADTIDNEHWSEEPCLRGKVSNGLTINGKKAYSFSIGAPNQ